MGNTVIFNSTTAANSSGDSLWDAAATLGWSLHFPKSHPWLTILICPVVAEVASSQCSHQSCLWALWDSSRWKSRRIPEPRAPQPASPGMNFLAALCTRHRKVTQGCPNWRKDLEHNMPWFQSDHPGVQETNPSHIIAPKSKTPWPWLHHKE